MKPIYILCPHWIRTGGPEAEHQLSDALIEQGFDARLVYYGADDFSVRNEKGEHVGWGLLREFPNYPAPSFPDYANYRIKPERTIDLDQPCVVVLPETLAHITKLLPDHVTVLIWWLSVDNAFGALGHINLNHLRKPNVLHAPQSEYAGRVLDALGLVSAGPLSDYTVDLTKFATPMSWEDRPPLVLFNANHKVIANWPAIVMEVAKLDGEISCQALASTDRANMARLFATARVYVDLGSFPGKDRMPREATTMGCCAIVSHAGASGETGAFVCGSDEPAAIADLIVTLARGRPQFFNAPEREIFFQEARCVFSEISGRGLPFIGEGAHITRVRN